MVDIIPMETPKDRESDVDRLVTDLTEALRETRDELNALRTERKKQSNGKPTWLTVMGIVAPLALFVAGAAFGWAWQLDNRVVAIEAVNAPTVMHIENQLQDHENRLRSLESVHRDAGGIS